VGEIPEEFPIIMEDVRVFSFLLLWQQNKEIHLNQNGLQEALGRKLRG
jgi:hypothetical protein